MWDCNDDDEVRNYSFQFKEIRMKKLMTMMLGLSLLSGTAVLFAQGDKAPDSKTTNKNKKKRKEKNNKNKEENKKS